MVAQQKPTQHCKVIISPFKKKFFFSINIHCPEVVSFVHKSAKQRPPKKSKKSLQWKRQWSIDQTEVQLPLMGFLGSSAGKESACSAGDSGSISGLGRSTGEGNSSPLQYSGLENSMDCVVQWGPKESDTVSYFPFHFSPLTFYQPGCPGHTENLLRVSSLHLSNGILIRVSET